MGFKMVRVAVWVLVALLLTGAQTGGQDGPRVIGGVSYEVYENERFGFSLLYPADILSPADRLPDGTGRFFLADDGSAALSAYGAPKVAGALEAAYSQELAAADQTVTYGASGAGWFVVSGYRNGAVFYQKTIETDTALVSFRIAYHPSWKPLMDDITTEISRAFVKPAP